MKLLCLPSLSYQINQVYRHKLQNIYRSFIKQLSSFVYLVETVVMKVVLGFHQRMVLALCALLSISFVLQLITVVSVPVNKNISLCTYNGFKFGVFGICKGDECTPIGIGYQYSIFNVQSILPSKARHSISRLLIVHPLATGFTFIQMVLSFLLFFEKFNCSAKFQIVTLFWILPTFLASLLAFLIDILLFIPHLDWPSWCLLVSTVFIALCGTVLCVMRRAVSSRKMMYKKYSQIQDQEYYHLTAYKLHDENGRSNMDQESLEDLSIDSADDEDSLLPHGTLNQRHPEERLIHRDFDDSEYFYEDDDESSLIEIEGSEEDLTNPGRAYLNSGSQTVYTPPKVIALPVSSVYQDEEQ